MARAVVFAYHNVGSRCLQAALARGLEVPLVVTHRDNPAENIWFESVAGIAQERDIPTIAPDDPNLPEMVERVAAVRPDFIFSFYYRHMLGAALLATAARGALNIHGSLLPKYRGRVPINWAVINGETETGASLHYMVEKPDAGDIVDQHPVPILPDDTALDVFRKVTVAAELVLYRSLPALLAGTAPRHVQDLSKGSYFGGRKPEDGGIDWRQDVEAVHNLVRGVAPPYPGAFTTVAGQTIFVFKTTRQTGLRRRFPQPTLFVEDGRCLAQCGDGGVLRLVHLQANGVTLDAPAFVRLFGAAPLPLLSGSLIGT